MGVNTINNLMQKMVTNSPLANTVTKKITNHSAWKTLVKKLRSNNIPNSYHRNNWPHNKKLDKLD